MTEFRKRFWFDIALCTTTCLSFTPPSFAADIDHELVLLQETSPAAAQIPAHKTSTPNVDVYTINFNNVSIIEFIRFASKITNLNFVFEDADLQFTVSVVSEEPITSNNVMSALAQVLRMHDLILLEQDGNVLITKSARVNQIPTIISSDLPDSQPGNSVLVTRVFRLKNANVNTIANIIRPMTSDTALIEVSTETRQLIVTDITTNVDQIAALLISLDAPHSPLDIETYVVKNLAPNELIPLATQILIPFTEGNPLLFVPQSDTNSIYIVSTPHLIERAILVMEDLDLPPKPIVIGGPPAIKRNIFIYKIQNRGTDELLLSLTQVKDQLREKEGPRIPLEEAIDSLQMLAETNSLMFLADDQTITKLKEILTSLDVPNVTKSTFFIYKIQHAQEDQIATALNEMRNRFQESPSPNIELIDAINTLRWIKETNSIVFTGSPAALKTLSEVLPTLDTSTSTTPPKSSFFIYNPQYRPGQDLYTFVEETATNLKDSGLVNSSFLQAIDSMKWVPSTNSLIFTGDPQALERIQAILISMDTPTPFLSKTSQVFIYKPQYSSPEQIQLGLQSLVPSLQESNTYGDQNLVKAIQALQWNTDTQSFMVTTDPATVERLKGLLASIDTAQTTTSPLAKGFFLYKLQNARGDTVIEELKVIASKLPTSTIQNKNLISAINKIEWVPSNNALLITGSPEAIDQIKTLIVEFDIPKGAPAFTASTFFIYKPLHLPGEVIKTALDDLVANFKAAGLTDTQLLQTLSSVRYVAATNSLLFTGTQESLDKAKDLLAAIDISTGVSPIEKVGNLTFLLYKLQYASADQFMSSLRAFSKELEKSNAQDQELAQAINSMKWIKETNSILFSGTQNALQRIHDIAQKFDLSELGPTPVAAAPTPPPTPAAAPITGRAATNFIIYNPKYITGDELISVLCDFLQNLTGAGVADPDLFDAIMTLKWIPKTNSLIVSGTPAAIDRVQALLQKFDIQSAEAAPPAIESIDNTSFLVYKLQFHSGQDIQMALKQVASNLAKASTPNVSLAEAINSLQWIQVTNSLLGTGDQEILVKLKELIQNLDIPLRQVFIEVLVVETTLTNTQNFGLQWGSQVKYLNKTVLQTGNFPVSSSQGSSSVLANPFPPNLQAINATMTPTNTSIPFSTGFDLGVIGDIIMHKGQSFISLGSLLNAIQLDTDSTVVINQKLITQDNRQSVLFVGENIPFTGAIVTNTTANTTTTANIEYRDVGVSLTITPMLGENDVITLDIVHDLSAVVGQQNNTSNLQLTGITTSHTHMETRVHVPDSKFLVLSGTIQDNKLHFRTAIPCLGSLPVVGALFSENDRTDQKNNFIIFVRPQIVHSYEEYKQITEHQEWVYKDQARLPVLKEEYEEGVDMVKTPEDE